MIIFNTTFHVEDDIYEQYISYMKDIYITEAANSGFLFEPRFSRIHAQHEKGGTSFSLQFRVKNVDTLNHWFAVQGQELHNKLTTRFNNKAVGFVTLMDEIEL